MAVYKKSDQLVLPGLSRPFGLGMLYDCRSDELIAGMTLWNNANIEKDVVTRPQPTTGFGIIASDTIGSKSTALDIDANLKMSFMSGLISVSGSAKYLDNRTSSYNQSRITMQYKCTTVFKQLSMSHLGKGNVQHPEVFDQGQATHVVTGILYGAHAFLVFDRNFSDEEMKKNIDGELHVLVKALPGIQIDGDASLKMSEDEKEKADKLEVQFHGDFRLHTNPTSYADAVKLYKDLPNLLGPNQENAVPMKVWLLPLTSFDSKAARLVREISANLVNQTEECMEQFHVLSTRCNDLLISLACRSFQGIREKLTKFRDMVNNYKNVFTKQLMPILPNIRGGGAEESELLQVISNKEQSPFSHHLLLKWLDNCATQIRVMERYISSMGSVTLASNPGDLSASIMDPAYRHCVCFTFQFTTEDQLKSAMDGYLRQLNAEATYNLSPASVGDSLFDRVNSDMAANCRNFIDFHKTNADRSGTTFIITEDTMVTDTPGAFIHLYSDGKLVDKDFKPPSKPGEPREEHSTHDELQVTWGKPDTGSDNITNYLVSYKSLGSDSWTVAGTKDTCLTFTIPTLIPATLYEIKVTAACNDAGNGPDSDISMITTRPTSPPAQPKVRQASASQICISWDIPTIIGENVMIDSYVIEGSPMIDSQKKTWSHCGCTDKLRYNIQQELGTPYKYRVIAKCEERTSLPSVSSEGITMTSNGGENMKARVLSESNKVSNSKHPSLFQVPLKKVTANSDKSVGITGMRGLFQFLTGKSDKRVRNMTFGTPEPGVPEKVILIVGATGAGKSTFINGVLNYVLGVEWKDDFRFKLVEEYTTSNHTPTKWITTYTLHYQEGFQFPYTLTIIDTPGFGDSKGIERDKMISEQMRHFFCTTGDGGIDHIDAIGFVTQSSLSRLTPSQQYIFEYILSLFGKDVAENIFLLVTFSDSQGPPVLAGVSEADLPYEKYFKFNNSALFAPNNIDSAASPDEYDFVEMIWKMGVSSYEKFLNQLCYQGQRGLFLTKSVLEERNKLEPMVGGIQKEIQAGLITLEQLKTVVDKFKVQKGLFSLLYLQYSLKIEKDLADFYAVRMHILSMTNEVRELINHLKEIALKPDPLSAVEYIDILIQSEKSSATFGWKDRVSHLTKGREDAVLLAQLASDGYDPFERYQEIIEEAKQFIAEAKQRFK